MSRLTRVLPSTAALALVLLAGACSKDDQPANSATRPATAYSLSASDEKLIAEKFPGAQKSPSGLMWIVRRPGTGTATPTYGSVAIVDYDLRLLDGTLIDSSVKDGSPLTIPVGVGRVIKGWDEALMMMKRGEKMTIIVPHWLAYGIAGSPPKIPPYATLVFDIELRDFH